MIRANARSTAAPGAPFTATTIEFRDPGPGEILIDIAFAGICHTDIDHARSTWRQSMYPLVPGHEIAGVVSAIGPNVTKFSIGDHAGIGTMVDSCRTCVNCVAGLEQYCLGKRTMTYNSIGRDGRPTYGGYSQKIVVDEKYAIRIPQSFPLESAAPLFCAGITMYSPLRHWNAGPGKRVGILGFGGLGHAGVQIARALGAHTTVIDISPAKREEAYRLGAHDYRVATDASTFSDLANTLDLIVSTVPVNFDVDACLGLLARDGTLVNIGVPSKPLSVSAWSLLANRRSISGTRIGSIAQSQEMIEFCARHGIRAEVEVVHADKIDQAFERILAGDVRYRFVIDVSTMAADR